MTKLKPPTLLFPKTLIFDDGKHRVELQWFGVAHTHGDGFAWLPKEKILFTGDACVNGAFNYVADGSITDWPKTLAEARKLGAEKICPGHGPLGDKSVLDDQIQYFNELTAQVKKLAGKSPDEVKAAVETIRGELKKNDRILRYVSASLPAHVEKVYVELGGKAWAK